MTALEVIGAIFAIFILVKVLIVLINPQLWMKEVAEPLLSNPVLAMAVYAILAIVVGYFVFTRLSIAEVAAVMFYTVLLIGLGLLPYSKALLTTAEEMLASRSELLRRAWLPLVIWVVIALWVLSTVFA